MNTTARHELPENPDLMKNLAFLMNETDPKMIVAQCIQTRHNNRAAFKQIFERASSMDGHLPSTGNLSQITFATDKFE